MIDTLGSLIVNVELLDVYRSNIEPKQHSDFCIRQIWIQNSILQHFRPITLGTLTSLIFHFLTYKVKIIILRYAMTFWGMINSSNAICIIPSHNSCSMSINSSRVKRHPKSLTLTPLHWRWGNSTPKFSFVFFHWKQNYQSYWNYESWQECINMLNIDSK